MNRIFSLLLIATVTCGFSLTNAEGFIVCTPAKVFQPNSTLEVKQIVLDAIAANQTVRGFGAGHSTNQILCANDGVTLLTRNLNSIISVDAQNMLVTVGSGMPLGKFLNDLVPH